MSTNQANRSAPAKGRVNTACPTTAAKNYAAKDDKLSTDPTGTVTETPSTSSFWRGVKQEAIAGLVVLLAGGGITGIGFLVYTVPAKLDHVIQNQEAFKTRINALESSVKDHTVRLIKLEMRP